MRNVPRQLLLSWYINFFQLRGLAELAVKRPGWPLLRKLWRDWAPGYLLPGMEWRYLCDQFAQPGVIDAALAYYRQNASPSVFTGWDRLGLETMTTVPVRTLVVSGLDDGCFDPRIYEHVFDKEDFPAGLRLEAFDDAGHFPHMEKPERFNALLLEWLACD
jgi:pimeloyl-ACP methyl ester carboxylesterase